MKIFIIKLNMIPGLIFFRIFNPTTFYLISWKNLRDKFKIILIK
jgi:hypothetical protein